MDGTKIKIAAISQVQPGSLIYVDGAWSLRASRPQSDGQVLGYLFLSGTEAGRFRQWWDQETYEIPSIAPGEWRIEVGAEFAEPPQGPGLSLLLTSQGVLFRGHDSAPNPNFLYFRMDGTPPVAAQNRNYFNSWGVVVGEGAGETVLAGPMRHASP